ncbi:hypothetical protein NA57DRAFT_61452 [Rhizodiscina lignyota]|uniref:Uncharacterized protein n=1 Tax=Rhizodiscina lignyota TaxID=1504668 RepID=A0A9P4M4Z7_9PEZI|nr:hypothetical protein NA57DRAFT_61452 [Rhizodiscina lignyota]
MPRCELKSIYVKCHLAANSLPAQPRTKSTDLDVPKLCPGYSSNNIWISEWLSSPLEVFGEGYWIPKMKIWVPKSGSGKSVGMLFCYSDMTRTAYMVIVGLTVHGTPWCEILLEAPVDPSKTREQRKATVRTREGANDVRRSTNTSDIAHDGEKQGSSTEDFEPITLENVKRIWEAFETTGRETAIVSKALVSASKTGGPLDYSEEEELEVRIKAKVCLVFVHTQLFLTLRIWKEIINSPNATPPLEDNMNLTGEGDDSADDDE